MSASVTIARVGLEASAVDVPTLGSYESWCRVVGPCLEAAGYGGFLSTIVEDAKLAIDTKAEAIRSFVRKWAAEFQGREVRPNNLVQIVLDTDGLPVRRQKDGSVTTSAIGGMLRKFRDNIVAGFCIHGPEQRAEGSFYWLSGDFAEVQGIEESRQQF